MIIMLYVSTTTSTICHQLKALLYMLYIASYCTDNLPMEKSRHDQFVFNNGKHIRDINVFSTIEVLECYPALVERNFESFVFVESK